MNPLNIYKMKHFRYILLLAFGIFASTMHAQNSFYTNDSPEIVRFEVIPDVKYGQGKILIDDKEALKDLTMDVYYPKEKSDELRPAIVLSYGGSFHRGNPRIPYVGIGAQTTTMSQYAMRYAEEGYVVFTINYRVSPDNPVIGPYEGFTGEDLDTEFFRSQAANGIGGIDAGKY